MRRTVQAIGECLVIGVRVTVPIACWRKPRAREFLESEELPPPATAYGALLSFVGELDRHRHTGVRVTVGRFSREREKSVVLRSLWRVKDRNKLPGVDNNVRPDFQQLVLRSDLLLVCDSSGEQNTGKITLEQRIIRAFSNPETVDRFGGWSLGESTHLINDAWLLRKNELPQPCEIFELDPSGRLTLPTWVNHVGTDGTKYARGTLQLRAVMPTVDVVPVIAVNATG